ncbi:hypothetical protein NDA14_004914 [Ustilago hordei]|nr:hypothetical protein NDA10_004950 [Ustilago hordei]KAJ1586342.1 hypothetical protein NDA12_007098 [Ustilago hordei]KAJ1589413.1 hypothetical protein NDA15_005173 [Ustilago hordei]KAJ1600908.1 hypothetical protein NDA14_004914 [Ustilago hordei]UTT93679.1 hypothetical protein NDA17_004369 [Ustilago hordei]
MTASTSAAAAAQELSSLLPPSRMARNLELHLAAEAGDLLLVKSLLSSSPSPEEDDEGGVDVWYEDPSSANWSALHFAAEGGHLEVVKVLLRHGAIWNAVDANGFTAAQVAWSRNYTKVYEAIFEEGVRQIFLLNALQGRNDSEEEAEEDIEEESPTDAKKRRTEGRAITSADGRQITLKPCSLDVANDTAKYLCTPLRFVPDSLGQIRCLDEDNNMVMAPWETDIMKLSTSLLLSPPPIPADQTSLSVLNVGFGLGIIDSIIQSYNPTRHVIIEAHPDAIAHAKSLGFDKKPGVEIFQGRWEDFIRDSDSEQDIARMTALGTFDAIYWDTYSQDYSDIKRFFESLPNLLNGPESRFSFFHGLGGTNQFFYDVYTRISESDLREIGLTTNWQLIEPEIKEEQWEQVKQKYWTLDRYYCPLARLDPELM